MKSKIKDIPSPYVIKKILNDLEKEENLIKILKTADDLIEIHKIFFKKIESLDKVVEIKRGPRGYPGKNGQNANQVNISAILRILKAQVEDFAQNLIISLNFKSGKDGENGKDGKSPTKKELKLLLKSMLPEPISPQKIISDVLMMIKIPKIDMSVVAEALKDHLEGQKFDFKHINGLEEYLGALRTEISSKGRYVHGGGDTLKAGAGQSITRNPDGTTTLNTPGGSSSISRVAVTGTIDGSNKNFELPVKPTNGVLYISLGRQEQIEDVDFTRTDASITYITAPALDLAGQPHYAIIN